MSVEIQTTTPLTDIYPPLSQRRSVGVQTRPLIGLSEQEARIRRERGLGNDVKFKTSRSYISILKHNLFTFFNMVLFIIGILLVLLGKPYEAVITSGVVLANVLVAIIQELRAKHKLDHIALLANPKARVIRDGQEKEIEPSQIVVGDLVELETGDQILVDGQLVGPGRLNVDESLLSGESKIIPKENGSSLFSGSICVSGRATMVAQKVGKESLANKLAEGARQFNWEYTPLQREVNLIVRVLLGVVTFFLVLHIIEAFLGKISPLESIRSASVLFGLAPSSLFLMIVVAYAWGAVRIAGKGALIQQANSVESLCNVTVLCLDKTGTITTNRIVLEKIISINQDTCSDFALDIHHLLGTYSRSLTSTTRTSQAITSAYPGKKLDCREEVLFSSQQGWSALSFEHYSLHGSFFLGAPEKLIPFLETDNNSLAISEDRLSSWINNHTQKGYRVLLFAWTPEIDPLHNDNGTVRIPSHLKPLCLLCFSDELRTNVRETLEKFGRLGVQIKIISGDSVSTTLSLAKQAGLDTLNGNLKSISGVELEDLDHTAFNQAAQDGDIFGRVTPNMKERLVAALREAGQYVAMTGDGVNDVMALKKANLGIAMQSGSAATRSVADMILLSNSFTVLPKAFEEGQRILNGLQDVLKLYLTRILYFALLVAAIGWLNGTSPFSPKGNSLISLLTLSIPAFALALWARSGPTPNKSLVHRLLHFIIPASILCCGAGLFVYLYFLISTGDHFYAQTTLTYAMVAIGIVLIIFVEPPTRAWVSGDSFSGDWRPTILAVCLSLLFILCLSIPQIRHLYDLVLLRSRFDYVIISAVVISWTVLVRIAWRKQLLDKYLKVDLGGPKIL